MNPPLGCVIPALNAAATLPAVIAGLRAAVPDAHVIGVDDGSEDGTADVLREGCDQTIVFERNRGKGAALRAGFAAALTKGVTAVLTIDADGQHDPSLAPSLISALADADVVVGSRQRRGTRMPIHRRMTNSLSSAAISAAARCPVADTQSGYRAIRARVIRAVEARGDRYEFETDFLIQAGQAGFRIACVPISTIYGSPSHFREIRDASRVIRTILRHHLRLPASCIFC